MSSKMLNLAHNARHGAALTYRAAAVDGRNHPLHAFSTILLTAVLVFGTVSSVVSAGDPGQIAYQALSERNYPAAIANFKEALEITPASASLHKDLAYTYLKAGDTDSARDQFGLAIQINPDDDSAALEYAFLCNETKHVAEAHRIFDRLRKKGNQTASQAFQNIDQELAHGIDRWTRALELSPHNFSAHEELAGLAEQRNDLPLAATQYQHAWNLRPTRIDLLVAWGRVLKNLGRLEEANALLLSASRSAEPRVAEAARELLPSRYPFVYEFQKALAVIPNNIELRRELAYLHLEMGNRAAAEEELHNIVNAAPSDSLSCAQLGFLLLDRGESSRAMPLLEKAIQSGNPELTDRIKTALRAPRELRKRAPEPSTPKPAPAVGSDDPKALGEKSLRAGYLNDALKYLTLAHEKDPADYAVMLKLGWANNMLSADKQAMEWFKLARKSPDPLVSQEAAVAYRNLRPEYESVRATLWALPFYSSRWKDIFTYSQAKSEFRLGSLPLRLYTSARFTGDMRNKITFNGLPQYLSESSVILGMGVSTKLWHGLTGWAEAGESIRYRKQPNTGFMTPDYRGGLAFAKSFGHNMGKGSTGLFVETTDDAVFVSSFNKDTILSVQNKGGYTAPELAGIQLQVYWNANLTADLKRQYWANFYETGPGVRFRISAMPKGLSFMLNAVRGNYTVNEGNPRAPIFYDFRAGFWYAFTH